MIHFFRDVLDGPLYLILVVVCIIFIMAIIGFIMERKKLEKEEMEKSVVIQGVTPVEPVRVQEVELSTDNNQEVVDIPNPLVNNEETIKREETFTIDSSNVQVSEVVDEVQEEMKAEDVVQVIDFGSTNDINVDNEIK